MIVGDQLSIVNFQRIVADLARNAQNLIGIVFGRARVPCLNVAELHVGKSEAPGDLSEKTLFVGMKDSVCHGDVEETFKHVLQEPVVVL